LKEGVAVDIQVPPHSLFSLVQTQLIMIFLRTSLGDSHSTRQQSSSSATTYVHSLGLSPTQTTTPIHSPPPTPQQTRTTQTQKKTSPRASRKPFPKLKESPPHDQDTAFTGL
jgi:hypothetical protein